MDTWNGKVTVDSKEYKIVWRHDRWDLSNTDREVIQPVARGSTRCWILDKKDLDSDLDYLWYGGASCSWSDNFCRRTGRKLSLQRALLDYDFTEQQRRQVWEQVLSIKGLVR